MNSNMLKSIFFFVVIFIATNSIGQTRTLSFEQYESRLDNEIKILEGAYIKEMNKTLKFFQCLSSNPFTTKPFFRIFNWIMFNIKCFE